MVIARETLPDASITLTVTIPWDTVHTTYEKVVEKAVSEAELSGFRKGKAPRDLVEKQLDKTKLYEDVIKELLPELYRNAIEQEHIHPIIMPKIELVEAKEGTDWKIRIITCEKPQVTLGDYKKAIQDLKASKRQKIWVPGKDEKPDDKKEAQKPTLDELLEVFYKTITITLPSILVEHEVNKLLSDLIDQTKKLGLTVDQYLSATHKTVESIRKEYDEQARKTLTLEFAIEHIAEKEQINVSDEDIEQVLKTAKTEEERKTLEKERYYLASMLRRQKTLEHLTSL